LSPRGATHCRHPWGHAPKKPSIKLYDVHFVSATTGWVSSDGGKIYKTSNAGVTWDTQTTPSTGVVHGLHFLDANTGWAVGEKGMVVKTIDGGG
jgi:photosystem II stability/assembly factor-like uncharacterized protein